MSDYTGESSTSFGGKPPVSGAQHILAALLSEIRLLWAVMYSFLCRVLGPTAQKMLLHTPTLQLSTVAPFSACVSSPPGGDVLGQPQPFGGSRGPAAEFLGESAQNTKTRAAGTLASSLRMGTKDATLRKAITIEVGSHY